MRHLLTLLLLIVCFGSFSFAVTIDVKKIALFPGEKGKAYLLRDEKHAVVTIAPKPGAIAAYWVQLETGKTVLFFEGQNRHSVLEDGFMMNPSERWIVFDTGRKSLGTAFRVEDLRQEKIIEFAIAPRANLPGTILSDDSFYLNDEDKFLYVTHKPVSGLSQFRVMNLNTGEDKMIYEETNYYPEDQDDLHFVGYNKDQDTHGVADSKIGLSTTSDERRLYDSATGSWIEEELIRSAYSMNLVLNRKTRLFSYLSGSMDVIVDGNKQTPFGSHCYPSYGTYYLDGYLIYTACALKIFDVAAAKGKRLDPRDYENVVKIDDLKNKVFIADKESVFEVPLSADAPNIRIATKPVNGYVRAFYPDFNGGFAAYPENGFVHWIWFTSSTEFVRAPIEHNWNSIFFKTTPAVLAVKMESRDDKKTTVLEKLTVQF